MADKQKKVVEQAELAKPLEWHYPPDLSTKYANNLVISQGSKEIYLSFFETVPPLILGTPEEMKEQLEMITTVRAECVARIVIARENMQSFLEAIQANMDRFLAKATARPDNGKEQKR